MCQLWVARYFQKFAWVFVSTYDSLVQWLAASDVEPHVTTQVHGRRAIADWPVLSYFAANGVLHWTKGQLDLTHFAFQEAFMLKNKFEIITKRSHSLKVVICYTLTVFTRARCWKVGKAGHRSADRRRTNGFKLSYAIRNRLLSTCSCLLHCYFDRSQVYSATVLSVTL